MEKLSEHAVNDMPMLMATQLQDNLMTVMNDLDRLQRLLDDSYSVLLSSIHGAIEELGLALTQQPDINEDIEKTLVTLHQSVPAIQAQDMATQLIAHTTKRLRSCADQIACNAMWDDEDGSAYVEDIPLRPNPVTQDEVEAGSVELF